MEALTCWLSDERRGVTYSWAARELCITSAAAVKLLDEYHKASPPKSLLAHYLVCGSAGALRGQNGAHSDSLSSSHVVSIVAADELEGASAAVRLQPARTRTTLM